MSTRARSRSAGGWPWPDWFLAARDRLLGSPRFQRWAAGFPLTRGVARRRARALFDLCAGFVYSQVLLACVQLQLFDILSEGPKTAVELSDRLKLSPEATARLLAAATSLHLIERRSGDRFGLGRHGAALRGNPAVTAMVEHHGLLYADLRDPVALLRGQSPATALRAFWPYAGTDRPAALANGQIEPYTALMSASQALIVDDVLDAYRLRGHRCMLDIGGGDGRFLVAAAARAPKLRVMLFDLPAVAERAATRFAAAGLDGRASAIGGNFLSDALPEGADVVSLVRVIHDHSDANALVILRAARRSMTSDGVLLIAEPISATRGAEPIADAYFGFYLLAMGSGRARSFEELASLLEAAGFTDVRQLRTRRPIFASLLLANAKTPLPARFVNSN